MYYLFILAFICNLYCATNNLPHILLIQDEKSRGFDFLINQATSDENRHSKFYCKSEGADTQGPEDLFPIEYHISYFSEDFNKNAHKESHKGIRLNSFYDDIITNSDSLAHPETKFVLAATDSNCKYLFAYLNSIKNRAKNIRCIFIHNPILSENANITMMYKRKLFAKFPFTKKYIKKLPHLDFIIPVFYELVSKLKGESYDAFEKQIIDHVDDIANSSAFCTTPIIITYDKNFADDAQSLYEILLNDRFITKKCPVLLLDSSTLNFKIIINNIISTYYQRDLFPILMNQKNETLINSGISQKTQKMLADAKWFASKTPLQQLLIRRTRDALMLLGFIVCCHKTIKTLLSFIQKS